jgi:hypothetical protein
LDVATGRLTDLSGALPDQYHQESAF